MTTAGATHITNLPESLFVLAVPSGDEESGQSVLKATSPDGKSVVVAFTRGEFLKHFVKATGIEPAKLGMEVMEIRAGALLANLAAANETELCVDPAQASERMLRYDRPGHMARRAVDGALTLDIHGPQDPLDQRYIDELCEVARGLPTVEAIWLLEVTGDNGSGDTVARPLLIVKQNIAEDDERFDDVFMELGDQWCETLPRGQAVDMLPAHLEAVSVYLDDAFKIYPRAKQ